MHIPKEIGGRTQINSTKNSSSGNQKGEIQEGDINNRQRNNIPLNVWNTSFLTQ